jgi:hypothetical protein
MVLDPNTSMQLSYLELLESLYTRTKALENIKQSYKRESCSNLAAFVLSEGYSSEELFNLIKKERINKE